MQITAPAQTAANPLVLTLNLDASLIPAGETANTVSVFRNNVAVDACTGAPGEADPDPCVAERTLLGDGDVEFRILTSAASVWNLGVAPRCNLAPLAGCLGGAKTSFQVKNELDDTKDQVKFKIAGGDAFDHASLGDPAAARTYSLCIYDETAGAPELVGEIVVGPNASWSENDPKGFTYKDTSGAEDGVQKAKLKTGAAGAASVSVLAKGANTPARAPLPAIEFFNQDSAVTVQLVNDQTSTCWSAEYTTATKNDPRQFKAKTP